MRAQFLSFACLTVLAMACGGCGDDRQIGDADEAVVVNKAKALQSKADAVTDQKIADIEAVAEQENSAE